MRKDWYWFVRDLRLQPVYVRIIARIIDDETGKIIMIYAVDRAGKQYKGPASWFTYRRPIVYT